MRRLPLTAVAAIALGIALPVAAQNRPKDLQPLPDVPPPPPGFVDPALEPQVTIVRRGEDKVEEYRVKGKLYMIKVTPPHGKPYYLVDEQGEGKWIRHEAVDTGLRVPMWVIHTF